MIDIDTATSFIATNARVIDRRRFEHIQDGRSSQAVMRALLAYRNGDGGIGYLEPDLRTPASQPTCVLYALEILHEVDAGDRELAVDALGWLQTVTGPDGGVPSVLPTARGWPHAPWYPVDADPSSSLLMTAAIAAAAHRLELEHPWLHPATDYCWAHMPEATTGGPYTVRYALDFLDAAPDQDRAQTALQQMADRIPADGLLRVQAGTEGEVLRPLELAPWPEHAARRLFDDAVIERELDHLSAGQQEDGGWTFTWAAWNPAVANEWRGAVTIAALRTLCAYGRLELPALG